MADMIYGNSKFYITKLIPFLKMNLWKQSIRANAKANKYKVKAKNFIIPILYFSVFFLQ